MRLVFIIHTIKHVIWLLINCIKITDFLSKKKKYAV